MYEVTQTRYRLATDEDEMPNGQLFHVSSTPGLSEVIVRRGEATARLLDQLTEQHRPIHALGNWMPRSTDTEDMPGARRIREARWQLTPAHEMPTGHLAMPLEGPGRFLWLIRATEARQRLVDEMNTLLAACTSSGLWIQRWELAGVRRA
ncbi:hypothetical protein [Streptomyces sp. NPDC096153]|uniref:hypothetical protein n=1 Tax=Streptomyces sp. NPDC096153 TaxID=3155548 RepID=UPI00331A5F6A